MNRRAFLSTLVAGLATPIVDLDRLLWVPGRKKIFIPTYTPTDHLSAAWAGQLRSGKALQSIMDYEEREAARLFSSLLSKHGAGIAVSSIKD